MSHLAPAGEELLAWADITAGRRRQLGMVRQNDVKSDRPMDYLFTGAERL